MRYTAREGGDILNSAAVSNLQTLINKAQAVAKFQSVTINGTTPTAELQLTLVPELYPFRSQGL